MKRSAGILVYKKENNKYFILLAHMGGPFFKEMDNQAWAIPKGEIEGRENVIECAKREFNEETNLKVSSNLNFLSAHKVSRKKLAIIFYCEENILIENFKSNTFKREYPKNSGIINEYPEMDNIKWIELNEAKEKIIPSQIFFLNRLEEKIKKELL